MLPKLQTISKPLACAAALVLAFAAGRYARPTKVETHSIEDTQKRTEQKVEQKTSDAVAETKATDTIKKHVDTKVTKKDGTIVETVADTVEAKQTDKQVEVKVVDHVVDRIVYQDRFIEKTKLVENKKAFLHIGPDVGASLSNVGSYAFGGHVEVRALGPVWVGLHVNTRGAVTLGLSLEF